MPSPLIGLVTVEAIAFGEGEAELLHSFQKLRPRVALLNLKSVVGGRNEIDFVARPQPKLIDKPLRQSHSEAVPPLRHLHGNLHDITVGVYIMLRPMRLK